MKFETSPDLIRALIGSCVEYVHDICTEWNRDTEMYDLLSHNALVPEKYHRK